MTSFSDIDAVAAEVKRAREVDNIGESKIARQLHALAQPGCREFDEALQLATNFRRVHADSTLDEARESLGKYQLILGSVVPAFAEKSFTVKAFSYHASPYERWFMWTFSNSVSLWRHPNFLSLDVRGVRLKLTTMCFGFFDDESWQQPLAQALYYLGAPCNLAGLRTLQAYVTFAMPTAQLGWNHEGLSGRFMGRCVAQLTGALQPRIDRFFAHLRTILGAHMSAPVVAVVASYLEAPTVEMVKFEQKTSAQRRQGKQGKPQQRGKRGCKGKGKGEGKGGGGGAAAAEGKGAGAGGW